MKLRKKRSLNNTILLLTALVGLFAVNLLASRHSLRLDLTEKKEYTLSPSTKNVLRGLNDIVTIRVYFTNELPPPLLPLRRAVDDLLAEFRRAGGSKLTIEYRDPQSDPMEEQKLAMMGIPPVQLNVMGSDRQEVAKAYLGMAILHGDKQEVIPVVQRASGLEYELTQSILKVSTKELPTIGFWAPLTEEADGYKAVHDLLAERYQLIDIDAEKPALDVAKFSTLFLAEENLSDDQLYAIDQFLMAGGKVMAFVDTWKIGQGLMASPVTSGLADLVMHYGVTVDKGLVLDRSNATAAFSGGAVTYHLPYPYWVQIRPEGFADAVPMVAELESLVLPWANSLTLAASTPEKTVTALATTTPFGIVNADENPNLGPEQATQLLREGSRGKRDVLAMVSGKMTSAFGPGGKQPPKGTTPKMESREGSQLIVAGTSRLVQNQFLQMFPQNRLLVENALDSMSWGEALIGIRSRESVDRPLALLSDGLKVMVWFGNVLLAPLLVLFLGGVVFVVRKRKWKRLKMLYTPSVL
ncbi:MAG: GldG family protein [Deltaproteobacteria bacterium]|nr:GldG family protein [Deltaproteobacteria bacterium]